MFQSVFSWLYCKFCSLCVCLPHWRAFCILHFILVRFSLWWTGGPVQVCHTFPGSGSPTQQCTGLTVKKTEWPPSAYLILVLDRFCVNVNRTCYLQCYSWCALSVVSPQFPLFLHLILLILYLFVWFPSVCLDLHEFWSYHYNCFFFFFFCICFSVSCICF